MRTLAEIIAAERKIYPVNAPQPVVSGASIEPGSTPPGWQPPVRTVRMVLDDLEAHIAGIEILMAELVGLIR